MTDGAVSGRISAEQSAVEDRLVETVLASFADTADPRLKQLLESLTRHLHSFIRDVRLTEQEWNTAIEFLTQVGHITDDKRQEFVLLSDVLGASMQTIAVNNQAYAEATEATVFGPFFREDAPDIALGGDIAGDAPGQPCWIEGTITDTNGNPVPHARIEVWEADEDGLYDVQHTDHRIAGRARLHADTHGHYHFWALTPVPYPIPHDGPVGHLLQATSRSPMRAAHLHFMVTADNLRTLVTHIFVDNDPQLATGDSVFGVKDSLIKHFQPQPPGTPTPDGRDLTHHSWTKCHFNITLAPTQH